ncbi:tyrosinenon-receptorprotein phosphatase non-receptor type 13 isoform X9 [Octopus vulgaris]|uniref:Tyrosinenon-receptorprotein phosphatase non-receptor type 13 isoform X9 n=1 Tax=Octopus vulgaris TaxID=6645 RepID=A0AA36ALG7_OCTVU|nr:tyrosinenon-receptorprotein phosphatase non-receptor type 13 isoform X9 [Octopus vulgaris]
MKDSVDAGEIFVHSIQPKGPADCDGQLQCNDQILAVDGIPVKGLSCKGVLNRIRQNERPTVKLLLFQRSQTSPVKDHTSPTSSVSDVKLPASSSCLKLSIKPSRALSSSTDGLDSTKHLKPKSSVTKSYFDRSYIPEHHVSTPNIFNSIYQTEDKSILPDTNHTTSAELTDKPQEDSKDRFSNGIKQTFFPTRPSQVLTKKIPSMKDVYLKKVESSNNTEMPASLASLFSSRDQLFANSGTTDLSERDSGNWTLLSKNTLNFKDQRPNEKFFECVLTKIQGSFGLNIIGGIDTKTDLGGVYVKSLQPGGAAQQNGTIQKNDRILSINDVSLQDKYHQQAVRILHDATDRSILVLGRVVEDDSHGTTASETLENSVAPLQFGGNIPQPKVDTKLDPNKTTPLPNPTSTTPILTSPSQATTMAKTAEKCQENSTQEFISKKESPETFCDLPKTYVSGTKENKVFQESPSLKEECNSSATCEDHKKCCQDKNIYFPDRNNGAIINNTVTPKGSRKDPTLSDRISNELLKVPDSVTDEKLGFDEKNTSKDKCPKNEEQCNILAANGYKPDSPNGRIEVKSNFHSTLSEDCGQFSSSQEKKSVCKSKLHKATLVNADVSENLSESVSETNLSESMNHKVGFTSEESLEGNSDTMTAGVSSTRKTTTEQQCLTQMCEMAEKNRVFQVRLKKSESGNYGFSLVPAFHHNNYSRLVIKAISESGVAAQDGNLRVGDYLLQVNGRCVIGFSVKKVVSLLKKQSAATLTLTVHRLKCSDDCCFKELVKPVKNTSVESSSNVGNCSSDDKTEVVQENLNVSRRQQCLGSLKNGCQINNQNSIKDQLDKLTDDLTWLWQIPLVKVAQRVDSKVLLETQIYLLEALENNKYKNEFQSLKQVKPSNSSSKVAHLEQNRSKNRFHNIVPCTTSRSLRNHQIIHLVYRCWPYNINHLDIDSFLQFVQTIQHYRPLSRSLPDEQHCSSDLVIVHCSSGSSLSALIIAVDVAVIHIQNNIKFNLFDIVSDLRLQRPQMIETEDQYRICYQASLRAVQKLF